MYGNFLVAQILIDDIHHAVKNNETDGIDDLYEKMEYRLMCMASCCAAFIDGKYNQENKITGHSRSILKGLEEKYKNSEDPRFKEL